MPYRCVTISAYDCPHISAEEIARVRKNYEGWPEFADSVLGVGFLPLVQDAVIDAKALELLLANPPKKNTDGEIHAFCDFAWSNAGAENVLALRRGNYVTLEATFHADNLHSIVDNFVGHFIRLGLTANHISGDEGGGGKLVLDEFEKRGWCLSRFNFGAAPHDSEHYVSIGAEMWYEGSKLITNRGIIIPNDQTLRAQLMNRKRKRNDKGKLAIEPKEDLAARGIPSPDRADAVLGCCTPLGGYWSGELRNAVSIEAPSGSGTPWHSSRTGWSNLPSALRYSDDEDDGFGGC